MLLTQSKSKKQLTRRVHCKFNCFINKCKASGLTSLFIGQFYTKDFGTFTVNWRINKLLLPHNLYFGAKHIPLLSQKVFVLLAPIFIKPDKYNITVNLDKTQ